MPSKRIVLASIVLVIGLVLLGLFAQYLLQMRTSTGYTSPFSAPVKPVLEVHGQTISGYWMRDNATDLPDYVSSVEYAVSNTGNANAETVSLTTRVDGQPYSANTISMLAISQTETYWFSISTSYDSRSSILIEASCQASEDSCAVTVGSNLPRYWVQDQNVLRLFVTPKESNVVQMRNAIIKDKFFLIPNWIALRDWVGKNMKYEEDSTVHGTGEYWQLSKETLALRTGDCEDHAILTCSLLRADGWSANDAFVVIGKNSQNMYHAWVKINLGILGWYNLEPQQDGWSTIIGDFLSLSGYTAVCQFNDQQYRQLG